MTSQLRPSELRIAEFASRGISNEEIAKTLGLSINTVNVYMGRIFTILDINNRAQLAEWILKQTIEEIQNAV